MGYPNQVSSKDPQGSHIGSSKGFVLLEALVAMSLILSVWMSLVATYETLALRTTLAERKRAQLRSELDAFEVSENTRVAHRVNIKGQIHESSRVSGRNRAQHAASKPSIKNQR